MGFFSPLYGHFYLWNVFLVSHIILKMDSHKDDTSDKSDQQSSISNICFRQSPISGGWLKITWETEKKIQWPDNTYKVEESLT